MNLRPNGETSQLTLGVSLEAQRGVGDQLDAPQQPRPLTHDPYEDGSQEVHAKIKAGRPAVDWDVHRGCDLDFDPWPYGRSMGAFCFLPLNQHAQGHHRHHQTKTPICCARGSPVPVVFSSHRDCLFKRNVSGKRPEVPESATASVLFGG